MIRGNKPNGYFITSDGTGVKTEGITYQCIHCQFMWVPKPGSRIRRGWCNKHSGWLCGRQVCIDEQYQRTGNYHDCMTIEEYNDSIRDHVAKYHRLTQSSGRFELLGDGRIRALDMGGTFIERNGLIIPS